MSSTVEQVPAHNKKGKGCPSIRRGEVRLIDNDLNRPRSKATKLQNLKCSKIFAGVHRLEWGAHIRQCPLGVRSQEQQKVKHILFVPTLVHILQIIWFEIGQELQPKCVYEPWFFGGGDSQAPHEQTQQDSVKVLLEGRSPNLLCFQALCVLDGSISATSCCQKGVLGRTS